MANATKISGMNGEPDGRMENFGDSACKIELLGTAERASCVHPRPLQHSGRELKTRLHWLYTTLVSNLEYPLRSNIHRLQNTSHRSWPVQDREGLKQNRTTVFKETREYIVQSNSMARDFKAGPTTTCGALDSSKVGKKIVNASVITSKVEPSRKTELLGVG